MPSDTPKTDYLFDHKCGRMNERQCAFTLLEHARSLERALARAEGDAAYCKWRLNEIIPLFEEARDALTSISLASAKLHNLRLDLGDRMDRAGTRTREEFDALSEGGKR